MPYCLFLESPARGYFGSFPTQFEVEELYSKGVRLFVNLTLDNEDGLGTYVIPEDCKSIHFPIVDRTAPTDWYSFTLFLVQICGYIREEIPFFIHCRAGHGRSSTVCASILCQLDVNLHPEHAITHICEAHSKRDGLGKKWKHLRNPMYRIQQIFIYKFFSTIFFCKAYQTGSHVGFSSFSLHAVYMDEISFPTAEVAFQYHIAPNDPSFKKKLLDSKKFAFIKLVGDDHWLSDNSAITIDEFQVMYKVCKLKYKQNPDLQNYLKCTCLRRLFDGCKYSHADNLVGRVLMKIREEYFQTELTPFKEPNSNE